MGGSDMNMNDNNNTNDNSNIQNNKNNKSDLSNSSEIDSNPRKRKKRNSESSNSTSNNRIKTTKVPVKAERALTDLEIITALQKGKKEIITLETKKFENNDRVYCRWPKNNLWYWGKVISRKKSNLYKIQFDDGDILDNVTPKEIIDELDYEVQFNSLPPDAHASVNQKGRKNGKIKKQKRKSTFNKKEREAAVATEKTPTITILSSSASSSSSSSSVSSSQLMSSYCNIVDKGRDEKKNIKNNKNPSGSSSAATRIIGLVENSVTSDAVTATNTCMNNSSAVSNQTTKIHNNNKNSCNNNLLLSLSSSTTDTKSPVEDLSYDGNDNNNNDKSLLSTSDSEETVELDQDLTTQQLYEFRCKRCLNCKKIDCGLCASCIRNQRRKADAIRGRSISNVNSSDSSDNDHDDFDGYDTDSDDEYKMLRECCLQKTCHSFSMAQKRQQIPNLPEGWYFYFDLEMMPSHPKDMKNEGLFIISPSLIPYRSMESAMACNKKIREKFNIDKFYKYVGLDFRNYSDSKTVGSRCYCLYPPNGEWYWGTIVAECVSSNKKRQQKGKQKPQQFIILFDDGDRLNISDGDICTERYFIRAFKKEPPPRPKSIQKQIDSILPDYEENKKKRCSDFKSDLKNSRKKTLHSNKENQKKKKKKKSHNNHNEFISSEDWISYSYSPKELYERRCNSCYSCKKKDCGLCISCVHNNSRTRRYKEVCVQKMCCKIPEKNKVQPAVGFPTGWRYCFINPRDFSYNRLYIQKQQHRNLCGLVLLSPMGRCFTSVDKACAYFYKSFGPEVVNMSKAFYKNVGLHVSHEDMNHILLGRGYCHVWTNVYGIKMILFGTIVKCEVEYGALRFTVRYEEESRKLVNSATKLCSSGREQHVGTFVPLMQSDILEYMAWGGCILYEKYVYNKSKNDSCNDNSIGISNHSLPADNAKQESATNNDSSLRTSGNCITTTTTGTTSTTTVTHNILNDKNNIKYNSMPVKQKKQVASKSTSKQTSSTLIDEKHTGSKPSMEKNQGTNEEETKVNSLMANPETEELKESCISSLPLLSQLDKLPYYFTWIVPSMRVEDHIIRQNGERLPRLTLIVRGYKLIFSAKPSRIPNAGYGVFVKCICLDSNSVSAEAQTVLSPETATTPTLGEVAQLGGVGVSGDGEGRNLEKGPPATTKSTLSRIRTAPTHFKLEAGEFIDLGVYTPFRTKDKKEEHIFLLKNFIHSLKCEEWCFDTRNDCHMFDITDDITGELHELAREHIPAYVNETDGNEQTPSVRAEHDPEGSVHYLLGHGEESHGPFYIPVSENTDDALGNDDVCNNNSKEIEILIDYGDRYENVRIRKGYSRLSESEQAKALDQCRMDEIEYVLEINDYNATEVEESIRFLDHQFISGNSRNKSGGVGAAGTVERALILAIFLKARARYILNEFGVGSSPAVNAIVASSSTTGTNTCDGAGTAAVAAATTAGSGIKTDDFGLNRNSEKDKNIEDEISFCDNGVSTLDMVRVTEAGGKLIANLCELLYNNEDGKLKQSLLSNLLFVQLLEIIFSSVLESTSTGVSVSMPSSEMETETVAISAPLPTPGAGVTSAPSFAKKLELRVDNRGIKNAPVDEIAFPCTTRATATSTLTRKTTAGSASSRANDKIMARLGQTAVATAATVVASTTTARNKFTSLTPNQFRNLIDEI